VPDLPHHQGHGLVRRRLDPGGSRCFTGRRLRDYFGADNDDWVNARRIINRQDRAQLIASYGKSYYAALSYTT
jgi:hypothetical protein